MKTYRVYVSHGCAGCPDEEETVELPDDASPEEIDETCRDVWKALIESLDSGWDEIVPSDVG